MSRFIKIDAELLLDIGSVLALAVLLGAIAFANRAALKLSRPDDAASAPARRTVATKLDERLSEAVLQLGRRVLRRSRGATLSISAPPLRR